ncbi:hypothetical protein [Secundilactobacillus odoratitofui]|nr:hypothetical protein [Secundilactobacillus odoratitofui]
MKKLKIVLIIVLICLLGISLRWLPFSYKNAIRFNLLMHGQVVGSVFCEPTFKSANESLSLPKKGAKIYSIGKYNYMDYDLASNITDYEAYTFKGKIIAKPLAEYMP